MTIQWRRGSDTYTCLAMGPAVTFIITSSRSSPPWGGVPPPEESDPDCLDIFTVDIQLKA